AETTRAYQILPENREECRAARREVKRGTPDSSGGKQKGPALARRLNAPRHSLSAFQRGVFKADITAEHPCITEQNEEQRRHQAQKKRNRLRGKRRPDQSLERKENVKRRAGPSEFPYPCDNTLRRQTFRRRQRGNKPTKPHKDRENCAGDKNKNSEMPPDHRGSVLR